MSENENPKAPTADDLSRREWILRLGEFVALAGISGVVPGFAAALRAQEQPNVAALPPGLYEPSQDHLVHALSSAGKNWTPPPGSETDYVTPNAGPYRPQFFSEEEVPTVTRIMELLLGNVDPAALAQATQWFDLWLFSTAGVREAAQHLDPMHRALAVAFFGEKPVRELETNNPQSVARVGLRALHDFSNKLYSRDFLQLSETEQIDLMKTISKAEPGTSAHKFFTQARTQAIRGYYTSPEGLRELDYRGNAYYGECPGCDRTS